MREPIQLKNVGYAGVGKAGVLSSAASKQVCVKNIKVYNRSGGALDVGALKKHVNGNWKFYTIVAASTPDASDVTSTIQAGSTVTVFTTTNNDGFLLQSKNLFNLIGLTVAQAPSGGSPAYSYQYYDGSNYVTLTTIAVPSYGTGTNLILFNAPSDWAVGTSATVGGDSDKYSILVRATTAPNSVTGTVNAAWVGSLLDFQEALADNANLELDLKWEEPLILEGGEDIMPYFSGSGSASNAIRVMYKVIG